MCMNSMLSQGMKGILAPSSFLLPKNVNALVGAPAVILGHEETWGKGSAHRAETSSRDPDSLVLTQPPTSRL